MQLFFTAIILMCLLVITAYAEEKPRYIEDHYQYNRAEAKDITPAEPPAYREENMADNQLDSACQSGDQAACLKIKQYQDEAKGKDNDAAIIPASTPK